MTWWRLCNLINAPHRFFPITRRLLRTTVTFSLFPTTSLFVSARLTHETQKPVMGFIGRLGKRVRSKQAKEVRQVFKRALDFSPRRSSNVLPNKRKRKRPPETKEELAYWLSKSEDKVSEKQFFVRPNRPFRTLPPRLVPAGALLYIVPAFLGGFNFIFILLTRTLGI